MEKAFLNRLVLIAFLKEERVSRVAYARRSRVGDSQGLKYDSALAKGFGVYPGDKVLS